MKDAEAYFYGPHGNPRPRPDDFRHGATRDINNAMMEASMRTLLAPAVMIPTRAWPKEASFTEIAAAAAAATVATSSSGRAAEAQMGIKGAHSGGGGGVKAVIRRKGARGCVDPSTDSH